LTKIAVKDGISVVQIRNLYDRARSKGAVDFKIYLKYQMSRSDNRGRTIISKVFGDKLLSFLSRYQKQELTILLRYAVMLYDYIKQEEQQLQRQQKVYSQYPSEQQGSGSQLLSDNIKKTIEHVIKANTSTLGFAGLKIEQEEEYGRVRTTIHVKLSRSYGDPKVVSMQLKNALKAEVKEIANTFFNVWIDR